jgi:hypothetical protein
MAVIAVSLGLDSAVAGGLAGGVGGSVGPIVWRRLSGS